MKTRKLPVRFGSAILLALALIIQTVQPAHAAIQIVPAVAWVGTAVVTALIGVVVTGTANGCTQEIVNERSAGTRLEVIHTANVYRSVTRYDYRYYFPGRNFPMPHSSFANISTNVLSQMSQKLGVSVTGYQVYRPAATVQYTVFNSPVKTIETIAVHETALFDVNERCGALWWATTKRVAEGVSLTVPARLIVRVNT